MKTENEMNNNGQRTPAAGNGTRKPNFRHKNYRYKAQPKKEGKDGQKQGQDKQTKGNYKPQFRGQTCCWGWATSMSARPPTTTCMPGTSSRGRRIITGKAMSQIFL